jgi:endo-1,4-beta-xylanase
MHHQARGLCFGNITMILLSALLLLTTPANGQLNKWAKAAGLKYFGTAVDNPALGNPTYMRIARDVDEFGAITPANGQKWALTQPSQGQFSYGSGDAITNIAKGTGQLVRCHTLVWHNQLPGWGMSTSPPLAGDTADART